MQYAVPAFSVQEVNAAGRNLAAFQGSMEELGHAMGVIDNWRASHHWPLNTLYMTLKRRASLVDGKAFAAQRIKRLESILSKLLNEKSMKLSQMQDIGGCRAVVSSVEQVRSLQRTYITTPVVHTFTGAKDYIAEPKSTGYRSVHLKYKFSGKGNSKVYDGLKIEMQVRTALQHQWATAVEAAGTFTKEALKSNRGRQEWLRFFSLMSSVFALREGCTTVPGTPSTVDELHAEIRALDKAFHIGLVFSQYRAIIPRIQRQQGARYFLVVLDPVRYTVTIQGFKQHESQMANAALTRTETELPKDTSTQVCLVSVSSVSALKRAYPNYFLDTKDFLSEILRITGAKILT